MDFAYIIAMIIYILPICFIAFIVYKAINEDKHREKKEKEEFLHLPDNDKEHMILNKVEEHLRIYMKCLSVGNVNKMKYLCKKEYFDTLKLEEKNNKSIDGSAEINEKIQIISKGITEYKEYEDYEYITVTVLIKGYNYKQDKFGNNYGLDSFEKYSKYTITYSNLTDKSKEEKQGECSSCGAPLNIENGRCAYCGKYIGDTYSDILIININKKF